jgi:glyoxylase-like metal-dependent hydrolase (beta-lactamase superfamily II)
MPIYRITQFAAVNAYLVQEEDGLTLIDTLMQGGHKRILAAAETAGAPIRRIALTHAHGDHIGSLDKLAAALPDVEVLISARDARLLAKDRTPDPGEPDGAKLRGGYSGATTRPTATFAAGDKVGSLEVHAAPGHTPGQVAFLDPRDGTLYCADAYSTLGGVATSAKPNPRFPLPGLATWHPATALESAKALRALDPQRLAPGHGKVVEAPGAAMDRAIARGA